MNAKDAFELSNKALLEIEQKRKDFIIKIITRASTEGSVEVCVGPDFDTCIILTNDDIKWLENLGYVLEQGPYNTRALNFKIDWNFE